MDFNTTLKYIQTKKEQGNRFLLGTSTGYAKIDRETLGFVPNDLILISSSVQLNKATFILNTILETKNDFIYFSLDSSIKELQLMLISIKSDISLRKLYLGSLENEEFILLYDIVDTLIKKDISIIDNQLLNLNDIRNHLQLNKNTNIKSIVIDDIYKLLSNSNLQNNDFDKLTLELKAIAKEFNISIILLDSIPNDILNKFVDTSIFITIKSDKINLQILKNRYTIVDTPIELEFDKDSLKILDITEIPLVMLD